MYHGLQTEHLTRELLRFSPPRLGHDRLADILWQHYGLSGDFKALAGERDQNIRVRTASGADYLLKLASPAEDPAVIDFQICALDHLAMTAPDLPIPRNVPTLTGAAGVSLPDPAGGEAFHMRVLTYVSGHPMASVSQFRPGFVAETGDLMGRLNAAFQGFEHPASSHFMPWNILNGLITNPYLIENCLPDNLRAGCVCALARMSQGSFARMADLPGGIIHNDAHTGNLLVDPETRTHVVGLIDFGDMLRGPLVQDVGTTLSSFAETCPDLVEISARYIGALSRHVAFSDAQVDLVFDSILARLILTVQLMQFRVLENAKGAEMITDHELPRAIDTLDTVLALEHTRFTRALRDALGR